MSIISTVANLQVTFSNSIADKETVLSDTLLPEISPDVEQPIKVASGKRLYNSDINSLLGLNKSETNNNMRFISKLLHSPNYF